MMLNAAVILLLAADPAPQTGVASPIQIETIIRETAAGPVHAWIARVDLTDPRVSFIVTPPLEQREGVPARAEALLMPTDVWAEKEGVDLAVNAGFFARIDGGMGGPGRWTDGLPVDIVGLSRSDGRTVSPSRQGGRDVALLIDETTQGQSCPCKVRAGLASESDLEGVEDAVAGGSSREGDPGTPLVENGENRGATAQVEPDRRHPRTAAGVTRDGKTLVLLVVDGRQPGWSIGVTLPELAQMMIDAGAWNAINLDGGGSSAMWYRQPGAPAGQVLNHPSDGRVRPAANHLGVRVSTSSVGTSPNR
jgi:exopolysaccharide biosynthesis protein